MPYPGLVTAAMLGVTIVTIFYYMFRERNPMQESYEHSRTSRSNDSVYENGWHQPNRYVYRNSMSIGLEGSDKEECSICLNTVPGRLVSLNPCNHKFHSTCIKKWRACDTQGSRYCPNCRKQIVDMF